MPLRFPIVFNRSFAASSSYLETYYKWDYPELSLKVDAFDVDEAISNGSFTLIDCC
jgi:hypothetical protein